MRSLFRYAPGDVVLAGRAAGAIVGAYAQLRWRSVDAMRNWATPHARHQGEQARLLLAFRRASDRLPGTCLVRALALQRLLADHGHASELRIGVARSGTGLMAHAWLVQGDRVLVGAGQEAETFTVLASWPHTDGPSAGLFR